MTAMPRRAQLQLQAAIDRRGKMSKGIAFFDFNSPGQRECQARAFHVDLRA
jgi:hypothetical protein